MAIEFNVSIQAFILVDDPYFNEPGYEKFIKQNHYQIKSKEYNEEKQPSTLKYAMIDIIKSPPDGFADIIKEHFTKKKDEILNKVEIWIQNNKTYNADIKQNYTELKELLKKL